MKIISYWVLALIMGLSLLLSGFGCGTDDSAQRKQDQRRSIEEVQDRADEEYSR